ncbi:hypothetical protein ColKHC_09140 [Colletotrichum higginsianum]|nr:hypothetical protein ColKHC_09140 [Colletotrichum higginsianum]
MADPGVAASISSLTSATAVAKASAVLGMDGLPERREVEAVARQQVDVLVAVLVDEDLPLVAVLVDKHLALLVAVLVDKDLSPPVLVLARLGVALVLGSPLRRAHLRAFVVSRTAELARGDDGPAVHRANLGEAAGQGRRRGVVVGGGELLGARVLGVPGVVGEEGVARVVGPQHARPARVVPQAVVLGRRLLPVVDLEDGVGDGDLEAGGVRGRAALDAAADLAVLVRRDVFLVDLLEAGQLVLVAVVLLAELLPHAAGPPVLRGGDEPDHLALGGLEPDLARLVLLPRVDGSPEVARGELVSVAAVVLGPFLPPVPVVLRQSGHVEALACLSRPEAPAVGGEPVSSGLRRRPARPTDHVRRVGVDAHDGAVVVAGLGPLLLAGDARRGQHGLDLGRGRLVLRRGTVVLVIIVGGSLADPGLVALEDDVARLELPTTFCSESSCFLNVVPILLTPALVCALLAEPRSMKSLGFLMRPALSSAMMAMPALDGSPAISAMLKAVLPTSPPRAIMRATVAAPAAMAANSPTKGMKNSRAEIMLRIRASFSSLMISPPFFLASSMDVMACASRKMGTDSTWSTSPLPPSQMPATTSKKRAEMLVRISSRFFLTSLMMSLGSGMSKSDLSWGYPEMERISDGTQGCGVMPTGGGQFLMTSFGSVLYLNVPNSTHSWMTPVSFSTASQKPSSSRSVSLMMFMPVTAKWPFMSEQGPVQSPEWVTPSALMSQSK